MCVVSSDFVFRLSELSDLIYTHPRRKCGFGWCVQTHKSDDCAGAGVTWSRPGVDSRVIQSTASLNTRLENIAATTH